MVQALRFDRVAYMETASHGRHRLQLAVARSFWARLRGLLGTRELPDAPCPHGLLLEHCTSVHGGFMRYSLDVVYLTRQEATGCHRVTSTRHLPRWGISMGRCCRDANGQKILRPAHVLELAAGSIQRLGIQTGDTLWLENATG